MQNIERLPILSRKAQSVSYRFMPEFCNDIVFRKPKLDLIFPSMIRIAIDKLGLDEIHRELKNIEDELKPELNLSGDNVHLKTKRSVALGLLELDQDSREELHTERVFLHHEIGLGEPEVISHVSMMSARTPEDLFQPLNWMRSHVSDPVRRGRPNIVLGEATKISVSIPSGSKR